MKRLPDYQPGLGGIEGYGELPDRRHAAAICEALETLAFDEGMGHPTEDEACFKRQLTLQPDGVITRAGTDLLLDSALLDAYDPDKNIASPWCSVDVFARYNQETDTRYTSLTLMLGGFTTLASENNQRRVHAVGEGYRYETEVQPIYRRLLVPGHVTRSHSTAAQFEGRQEHIQTLLRAELDNPRLDDAQRDYATLAQAQAIEDLAEALISV